MKYPIQALMCVYSSQSREKKTQNMELGFLSSTHFFLFIILIFGLGRSVRFLSPKSDINLKLDSMSLLTNLGDITSMTA